MTFRFTHFVYSLSDCSDSHSGMKSRKLMTKFLLPLSLEIPNHATEKCTRHPKYILCAVQYQYHIGNSTKMGHYVADVMDWTSRNCSGSVVFEGIIFRSSLLMVKCIAFWVGMIGCRTPTLKNWVQLLEPNQDYALTRLSEASIPYTIVDGMDPLKHDEKNAMVAISGIQGNYPQIFVMDGNSVPMFLGGNDWLCGIEIEDLKSLLSC